jgi:molecular chaperone IbpA
MNLEKNMTTLDLTKFWLGMNSHDWINSSDTSYPRYNIVESKTGYRIEIAVPSWKKEELEVIHENNELVIKGKKERKLDEDERYVHQGLSLKSFERKFMLNIDLTVDSVELTDGMLTIQLERTPNSTRKLLEIK